MGYLLKFFGGKVASYVAMASLAGVLALGGWGWYNHKKDQAYNKGLESGYSFFYKLRQKWQHKYDQETMIQTKHNLEDDNNLNKVWNEIDQEYKKVKVNEK